MPTKTTCSLCGREFILGRFPQTRYCSPACRMEAHLITNRQLRRLKRSQRNCTLPCQVCGFNDTTDIHHEGEDLYILCPNHHAMLTRGKKEIKDFGIIPIPKDKIRDTVTPVIEKRTDLHFKRIKKTNQPKCEHGFTVCTICTRETNGQKDS